MFTYKFIELLKYGLFLKGIALTIGPVVRGVRSGQYNSNSARFVGQQFDLLIQITVPIRFN